MLDQLLQQVVALLAISVLLGVPGFALATLVRARHAVPDTLLAPVVLVLGSAPLAVATATHLALAKPIEWGLAVHVVLSVGLALWAILVHRQRRREPIDGDEAREETAPRARGWSRWIWLWIAGSVALAVYIRGQIKFDTLYHGAVARKLLELAEPGFGNVNRFADGGPNPAYALPMWHELAAYASLVSGADVLAVWQIFPVLSVALGVLAAAGLARVVTGSRTGEALGGLAWAIMRIGYGKRSVDGDAIVYGSFPGATVFEIIFPLLFAVVIVAAWDTSNRARRTARLLVVACLLATVVLHANYVAHVAIVGLGFLCWWLVTGPLAKPVRRRIVGVGLVAAVTSVVSFAILLPLLAQLENFGNAPEELRIDYHLTTTAGMTHIRGGHLYDFLGVAGLVALLAAPFVVARWRSRELSLIAGGLLGLGAMSFIPPLYSAMAAAGSLTVGLRINHVASSLLATVLAIMILMAAGAVSERAARSRRPLLVGVVSAIVGLALVIAVSSWYGYPNFGPNIPGYVGWLGLAFVFLWRLVRRSWRSAGSATWLAAGHDRAQSAASELAQRRPVPGRAVLVAAAVLVVGLAVPSGLLSLRQGASFANDWGPATEAGDLACITGDVADAVRDLAPGSTVLSDPVSSVRIMALAPVYVVGDYKVWNAATGDNRTADRLSDVNVFYDSSDTDHNRIAVLKRYDVDYVIVDIHDLRWLDEGVTDAPLATKLGDVRRRLDAFADSQTYDGATTVSLIQRNASSFELLAIDEDELEDTVPNDNLAEAASCSTYAVWRVRSGEQAG